MAGNIIPAIATTNAIVAGMIVIKAYQILSNQMQSCTYSYLLYGGDRPQLVSNQSLPPPNPECVVCSSTYLILTLDTSSKTLRFIIDEIISKKENQIPLDGDLSVEEGSRLIYDVEFDDNLDIPLKDMNIIHGSRLVFTNESQDNNIRVVFMIQHQDGMNGFKLQGKRSFKSKMIPSQNPLKRSLEEENLEPSNEKKFKMEEGSIVIDDEEEDIVLL